jgi:CRP/FNR family transcriptional regulator, cyclic AMP receptor protein
LIRTEILRKVNLFSELDQTELTEISRVAIPRHFPKDQVIFYEQDEGDVCFVIASGRVKVTIASPEGKEIILSVLEAGDLFGEMALFDNSPRSATIVALEDAEVYSLRRSDFLHILSQNFNIARKVMAEISTRLRRANSKIESLAHMDVNGRLARYLINLAKESGKRLDNGYVAVRRPTHQEIANTIGTARETVSRLLHDLAQKNVILTEGKTVYIRAEMLGEPDH